MPKRFRRRHYVAQRLAGLALVWFSAADVHAYCRLTTEMPLPGNTCSAQGIGLAWRRQCMSYSVMPREVLTPALDSIRDVADRSFATWNAVTCNNAKVGLDVAQTAELGGCGQPEYNTQGPNANTIIFVKDWSQRSLPADAFGLTLVWHNPDTGEIYDADMQLNETLGTFTVCNQVCPPGGVDLQNVITHEAGHFLGLGHTSVRTATMSARATVGETSKRILADDDRQGLCSIYGALPAVACQPADFVPRHGFSSSCAPAASSSKSSGCNATAIGASANGAGALLLLWALYMLRLRVGRSSASPSPRKR